MLGADRKEGRERLESRLHQEEGRTESRAYDTRCRSGKDVDAERLNARVLVDRGRHTTAQWLVEAETAAIQHHLVNILFPQSAFGSSRDQGAWMDATTYSGANASEQPAGSFILQDDLNTVEDTLIFLNRLLLCLQLSL